MQLKLLCLVMSCIFFRFIVYLEQPFLFHVFVLVWCCCFYCCSFYTFVSIVMKARQYYKQRQEGTSILREIGFSLTVLK